MGYALGQRVPTERERRLGYRAHFERMGYTEALAELDRRLAEGLDVAIVRVVAARPGLESVLAALRACRPELVHCHGNQA
jgi:hypothetical protein